MDGEQTELFEMPGDDHTPTVYYYHCGEGFIFKDEWRYFAFQLVFRKPNAGRKCKPCKRRKRRRRGD